MDQTFFARIKDVKFQPKDGEIAYVVQLNAALEPADLTKLAQFGGRMLQIHLHHNEVGERKAEQGNLFDPEPKVEKTKDGEAWYCAKCDLRLEEGLICTNCGQRHREPGTVAEPTPEPEQEKPTGPVQCTATATHLIKYDAGDGRQGTVFCCEVHRTEVTAMAMEYCEGAAVGTVLEAEPLTEDQLGKIGCAYFEMPKEEPAPTHWPCGKPAKHRVTDDAGDEGRILNLCDEHLEALDPDKALERDDAPEGATCEYSVPLETEGPDPLCVCGHTAAEHHEPGGCIAVVGRDGSGGEQFCSCPIFRSAEELAEENSEADAAAGDAEHEAEMAEAAGAAPIPLFGNDGVSPELERRRRQMARAEDSGQ